MWFALVATIVIGALLYKLFFAPPKVNWKKLGIPEIDTSQAVGKLDIILGRKPMTCADDYAYKIMKLSQGKFCAIMDVQNPLLLVRDVELMKKILIKDFDHFVDRRQFFSKEDGSLKDMLPSLEGDEWKGVRSSVSPTFTTGKIRRMMDLFNEVGNEWVEEFRKKAKSDPSGSVTIDVVQTINQYTVEIISRSVFGVNAGAIKNPDSTFIKHANKLSEFSGIQILKFFLRIALPRISQFLGLSLINMKSLKFFEDILRQGLRSRLNGEIKRNDFLQLLVEAHKGELKASGSDELSSFEKDAQINVTHKKQYLTEDVMNAQSFIFFFAGFSTTSTVISYILYAIALHPDVQKRLRQEVDKVVKEDGSLDYDEVCGLVYLDMVLNETMRKFPVAARLERVCTRDYKDPETGLVVPKGTTVGIPLNAIHHDKEFYDNPEKFDPEHFTPEKKAARSPYAFMPFGIGPRNCIGMRFAQIGVKSVVAHLVHNFMIEPTAKTPVPLQGKCIGLNSVPPSNLELRLTPISKK